MTVSMKREDLINALNRQLAIAEAEDRRAAAKHRKDEAVALVKFREKLKIAMKWDYETAISKRFSCTSFEVPQCPILQSTRFKTLLNQIAMVDGRKTSFQVRDSSDLQRALAWVPASKKQPLTVCD